MYEVTFMKVNFYVFPTRRSKKNFEISFMKVTKKFTAKNFELKTSVRYGYL